MNESTVGQAGGLPGGSAGAATAPWSADPSLELFGLGWRPPAPAGEYVGRHRAPGT
ncbi:hypothetical protein JDV09_19310 [Mycobacterium sp. Y57]|uniref:hypothetical protein n=1 Tax=Mycolicibacterium xanthum TaxID=2796469 RepID=UPI001C86347A|nr:hypothetical protein [Mycolicibacterium xanthum]MBX7434233.1 hypothetical protein [Mycolicibacterium xanthum]